MKKPIISILVILIVLIAFWFMGKKSEAPTVEISSEKKSEPVAPKAIKTDYNIPLSNAERRITKKPFGILIDPKTSPIPGERFSGYHTGTDFEVFSEETNVDVEVRAICEGEILQKKKISGYGGVIIQSCILNGEEATILYGHVKLSDSPAEIGKIFFQGDKLSILGADGSVDTDGERKHLHLGIKKGKRIDIRGYVSNKKELINWINAEEILFPLVL